MTFQIRRKKPPFVASAAGSARSPLRSQTRVPNFPQYRVQTLRMNPQMGGTQSARILCTGSSGEQGSLETGYVLTEDSSQAVKPRRQASTIATLRTLLARPI